MRPLLKNEYLGFWENEYLFWMNILDFHKCIIFWISILVLVCLRQNGFHQMYETHLKSFRDHEWNLFQSISGGVFYPYRGPRKTPKDSIFWPYFGTLNNFPQCFLMNNSIEYSGLYWMNIFLNEYFEFCFKSYFELNHSWPIQWKKEFSRTVA